MSLIIRFSLHFIAHQFLMFGILSIPAFIYTVFLHPSTASIQQFVIWGTMTAYGGYCLFYGYYVGRPLYQIITIIKRLAAGEDIPEHSFPPSNKWFYSRLYRDVFLHLHQLAKNLKASEEKQKELDQLRKDWAAGATHDLKTPLSYITGYSYLLMSKEYTWEEKEKQEFLQRIHEKAQYMEDLLQDLNIAFQIDQTNNIQICPKKMDFIEMIRRTIADVMNMPDAENYSFNMDTNHQSIWIYGDSQLLSRAIMNLLVNVVMHNPPGTHTQLHVFQKNENAILKIEDFGKGIDESTLKNLFTRYYRGTSTAKPTQGTGLGMSIVKQIILAHHGKIDVTSQLEHGTTFTIQIPLAKNS